MLVNMQKYSKHEQKEMVLLVIKKHTLGVTFSGLLKSIAKKRSGGSYYFFKGLVSELVEEGKVRKIDYGNAKLYKVVKDDKRIKKS